MTDGDGMRIRRGHRLLPICRVVMMDVGSGIGKLESGI